jgi:hypothetical protein
VACYFIYPLISFSYTVLSFITPLSSVPRDSLLLPADFLELVFRLLILSYLIINAFVYVRHCTKRRNCALEELIPESTIYVFFINIFLWIISIGILEIAHSHQSARLFGYLSVSFWTSEWSIFTIPTMRIMRTRLQLLRSVFQQEIKLQTNAV